MKVYLVIESFEYDCERTLAVFSTYERAKEYSPYEGEGYEIREMEIDPETDKKVRPRWRAWIEVRTGNIFRISTEPDYSILGSEPTYTARDTEWPPCGPTVCIEACIEVWSIISAEHAVEVARRLREDRLRERETIGTV